LLALEVLYTGLHFKPLLPLLDRNPENNKSNGFMQCFTTPLFFASELAIFALLKQTANWYVPRSSAYSDQVEIDRAL
jgi:hypothetical protein